MADVFARHSTSENVGNKVCLKGTPRKSHRHSQAVRRPPNPAVMGVAAGKHRRDIVSGDGVVVELPQPVTFPGNYFFEVMWSVAASGIGFGVSGCPSNTAVTELGSLSAFASIKEICHIWVSDRL